MKGWWNNNQHWASPLMQTAFTYLLAEPPKGDEGMYVDAD